MPRVSRLFECECWLPVMMLMVGCMSIVRVHGVLESGNCVDVFWGVTTE